MEVILKMEAYYGSEIPDDGLWVTRTVKVYRNILHFAAWKIHAKCVYE